MIRESGAVSDYAARGTRALLVGGAVAGPLFIAVAFIQAFARPGFDLARHPLSLLSLGDLGLGFGWASALSLQMVEAVPRAPDVLRRIGSDAVDLRS